jgi:glycosyltransferase involved in cell wall biosynthesis
MARPIVGTRVSGVPEIVLEGETGMLVEPGDGGALAEALVRLLEDPNAARRMGRAARRRVEERFSLERSADEYYALYERLMRGCDRAAS